MSNLLSVVIPVYNEGPFVKDAIKRVNGVLLQANIKHEFILIDDGSRDNSWDSIFELSSEYDNITAIKLSRNFGKESALCAGLDAVKGDCCVVMDADMQHPPEYIPEMYRLWKDEKFDVVEGVKKARPKESLMYKLCARLFYKLLKTLGGINLDNASDFRLMDKCVIVAWKQLPEKQTFFRAMSTWVGFNRTQLYFFVEPRTSGKTSWSLFRLTKLAASAITSFSALPLYFVAFSGFICLIFFFIMFIQTLYMKMAGNASEGFSTIIILLLMIGSILMISLGILGLYTARIYEEVKGRPRYLVSKVIRNKNKKEDGDTHENN